MGGTRSPNRAKERLDGMDGAKARAGLIHGMVNHVGDGLTLVRCLTPGLRALKEGNGIPDKKVEDGLKEMVLLGLPGMNLVRGQGVNVKDEVRINPVAEAELMMTRLGGHTGTHRWPNLRLAP